MALSLQEIREKLKQQEAAKGGGSFESDNASYPFWNITDGTIATLRFLPDDDSSNPFFWRERAVIKLPFPGIKGQDETKEVLVQVPCMHMFGKSCPITEEIKPWWDDEALIPAAKKYYKKRSYLYQGFVVNSSLVEQNTPENPIRRFMINTEIHNMIKAALMDDELDALPIDYDNGLDFRVSKVKKGKYASYETSSYSRKNRPLSSEELAALEANGLFTLNEFLPKEPDAEHLKIIMELFEASVDGQLYDPSKWARFYKPFGFQTQGDSTNTTTAEVSKEKVAKALTPTEEVVEKVVEETVTVEGTAPAVATGSEKKSPIDLLADLRRRKADNK